MTNVIQTTDNLKENRGPKLSTYITGFASSIFLTLIPYFLVTNHIGSTYVLLTVILFFALLQMIVQLIFFLHLGRETKPRWKLAVMISFVGIILIIVGGSIWIMAHLNYSMSLLQLNNLMQYGEGF